MNEGEIPSVENQKPVEKPKRGRKKSVVAKEKPIEIKRPRGRPRKRPLEKLDDHHVEALAVQASEDSTEGVPLAIHVPDDSSSLPTEGVREYTQEHCMEEDSGEKQNFHKQAAFACNLTLEASVKRNSSKDEAGAMSHNNDMREQLLSQNEHNRSSVSSHQTHINSEQDPATSSNMHGFLEMSSTGSSVPKDVALPRVVLCLAHNGKVAWDVKWRPSSVYDHKCKHRMGYLAVLLGNGSLEV